MSEGLFEQAYAQWLHARAAVADNQADSTAAVEREQIAADNALCKAEWRLIEQPARCMMHLKFRAEFVQQLFDASDEAGPPTDNRHRIALSGLVSEILRYEGEAEQQCDQHPHSHTEK
jgi:hypothetical protein